MPNKLLTFLLAAWLLSGCARPPEADAPVSQSSAAERLKPLAAAPGPDWQRGRSYVPIYSSLPWGFDNVVVDLAATLSIRNVSLTQDVVLESIDYYDSAGHRLRRYLEQPARLPAMASVEYVIRLHDRAGGPGANFLVDWSHAVDGEEPLLEAVMVGQRGNAGISFTTPGRSVRRR